METIKLNNGVEMPLLGYGVYLVTPDDCERCVTDAIETGYRLIDTAQAYHNEEGVGRAISKNIVPRQDLFITTKVWITNAGEEKAAQSIDESLRKLQTDYVDLLLVHQPFGDYYGTWRALEKALSSGKARAIGVSNFYPDRYADLAELNTIKPAVNQLLTNVFSQQHDAEEEHKKYDTKIMAWAPLAQGKNSLYNNALLKQIAQNHNKTVAQIALRYLTQRNIIAIPKTTHKDRMAENFNIFDFRLTDDEMQSILTLDIKTTSIEGTHRDPNIARKLIHERH